MHVVVIGGSDAGISAALRVRELRADVKVAVVVADAFPNYSVCGLPFFLSGETPDWHQLAHRTLHDLQQGGLDLLLEHTATAIDPSRHEVSVVSRNGLRLEIGYDRLVIATGAPAAGIVQGPQLLRRAAAEFVGTALLLIAVVGSGIAAQTLSPSDTGLALLENAIATGAALVAIILAVGSVSGAHLNPVVSCADAIFRGLKLRELAVYIVAQVAGACGGVVVANLMFSLPAVTISSHMRSNGGLWLAEVVATFGLLMVVFGVTRGGRSEAAPFAVGAYITGAYFFTSSTSFANPAVTLARTLSDTFAGIAPTSVVPFMIAQIVGTALACGVVRMLWPAAQDLGENVLVPHEHEKVNT